MLQKMKQLEEQAWEMYKNFLQEELEHAKTLQLLEEAKQQLVLATQKQTNIMVSKNASENTKEEQLSQLKKAFKLSQMKCLQLQSQLQKLQQLQSLPTSPLIAMASQASQTSSLYSQETSQQHLKQEKKQLRKQYKEKLRIAEMNLSKTGMQLEMEKAELLKVKVKSEKYLEENTKLKEKLLKQNLTMQLLKSNNSDSFNFHTTAHPQQSQQHTYDYLILENEKLVAEIKSAEGKCHCIHYQAIIYSFLDINMDLQQQLVYTERVFEASKNKAQELKMEVQRANENHSKAMEDIQNLQQNTENLKKSLKALMDEKDLLLKELFEERQLHIETKQQLKESTIVISAEQFEQQKSDFLETIDKLQQEEEEQEQALIQKQLDKHKLQNSKPGRTCK